MKYGEVAANLDRDTVVTLSFRTVERLIDAANPDSRCYKSVKTHAVAVEASRAAIDSALAKRTRRSSDDHLIAAMQVLTNTVIQRDGTGDTAERALDYNYGWARASELDLTVLWLDLAPHVGVAAEIEDLWASLAGDWIGTAADLADFCTKLAH